MIGKRFYVNFEGESNYASKKIFKLPLVEHKFSTERPHT